MSIQFEEEAQLRRVVAPSAKKTLAQRMVSAGYAKDESSANRLLMIGIVLCILLAIGIGVFSMSAPEGPTHEELIKMQQREGV